MQDLEMKKKVAQEIMALMDQKETENLKSKSPKFAKAAVLEVEPVEGSEAQESEESPELAAKEPGEIDELSPEMIEKLIEMMNGN